MTFDQATLSPGNRDRQEFLYKTEFFYKTKSTDTNWSFGGLLSDGIVIFGRQSEPLKNTFIRS